MKKVTVYTSTPCPYCSRAKDLLRRRGVAFEEVNVPWDDEETWKKMIARSGMRTVPQIFFGDECIGGFTELNALDQSGQLQSKLQ